MQDIRIEITEEDYQRYKKDPTAYYWEKARNLPDAWRYGYGWYGCDCIKGIDGKYYEVNHIGDSCE